MTSHLPAVIDRYLEAHDRHDDETAIAAFAPDAMVTDEGQTYVGSERIRGWLEHAGSEYTYTRTLTGIEELGNGTYVVRNHLSGDFPGGDADLRYQFRISDGLISGLEIAP